MAPPGYLHGKSENKIGTALQVQGEMKGLGKACGETGIILWHNPDRLVGADACFIAKSSLPVRLSPEGYLETIPDLVVEVRSKNDLTPSVVNKVEDYLTAGVKVVLVADPASKTITAYRRRSQPVVFAEMDILTVEDIIPGFQLLVRDAFQE